MRSLCDQRAVRDVRRRTCAHADPASGFRLRGFHCRRCGERDESSTDSVLQSSLPNHIRCFGKRMRCNLAGFFPQAPREMSKYLVFRKKKAGLESLQASQPSHDPYALVAVIVMPMMLVNTMAAVVRPSGVVRSVIRR